MRKTFHCMLPFTSLKGDITLFVTSVYAFCIFIGPVTCINKFDHVLSISTKQYSLARSAQQHTFPDFFFLSGSEARICVIWILFRAVRCHS